MQGGEDSKTPKTFAALVGEFRENFMVTSLKITSRRGYASVLDSTLLPRFGELPVVEGFGRMRCGRCGGGMCGCGGGEAPCGGVEEVVGSTSRGRVEQAPPTPPGGSARGRKGAHLGASEVIDGGVVAPRENEPSREAEMLGHEREERINPSRGGEEPEREGECP
jgi:hypothetical protein